MNEDHVLCLACLVRDLDRELARTGHGENGRIHFPYLYCLYVFPAYIPVHPTVGFCKIV